MAGAQSVADLEQAIVRYIGEHNAASSPFVWTKPADSIQTKLSRFARDWNPTSETPLQPLRRAAQPGPNRGAHLDRGGPPTATAHGALAVSWAEVRSSRLAGYELEYMPASVAA